MGIRHFGIDENAIKQTLTQSAMDAAALRGDLMPAQLYLVDTSAGTRLAVALSASTYEIQPSAADLSQSLWKVVDVPLQPSSAGELGQIAEDSDYTYTYLPSGVWDRQAKSITWERLAFVGPAISGLSLTQGQAVSLDVSALFKGIGRTYALVNAPAWMSINASGVISGTADVGAWSVTVRASLSGSSVDSNTISVSCTGSAITDFSAYSAGAFGQSYYHSGGSLAIAASPILAVPSTGKILAVAADNNTATMYYQEYHPGALKPIAGQSWEVLACLYVDNESTRVAVGYLNGAADGTWYAALWARLFGDQYRMSGTTVADTNSTVTRADWLSKWVWMNIRHDGSGTLRARYWLQGATRPAWAISNTYTHPSSPAANAGLGVLMLSQYTTTRHAQCCYLACVINQPELAPPSWANPSFPTISQGALSYLNAWSAVSPSASNRFTTIWADKGFPRLGVGDHVGDYSNGQFISMLDVGAANSVGTVFNNWPSDSARILKCTTQETQLNVNTMFGSSFNALSAYTSVTEGKLCPKHIAWQAGTTLSVSLAAGSSSLASNVAVADASKIVVNRHALIRPVGSGQTIAESMSAGSVANFEIVFVTSRNTTNNTITFYRGFSKPNTMAAANRRAFSAGAYICSIVSGGAASITNTDSRCQAAIPEGGTAYVSFNWRWNVSTQCPLDSNNTQVHDHIVDWVEDRFQAIYASIGKYPDGLYDDVDISYPTASLEEKLDCNNDGVSDMGLSSTISATPTEWWRAGVVQLENAIWARVGPGTTCNGELFVNGTDQSIPLLYPGLEMERSFGGGNWLPVDYSRLNHAFNSWMYWMTQVARRGPSVSMNLFRIYTEQYPVLQSNKTPNYSVSGNAGFRLMYAMNLMSDGIMAMPMSTDIYIHWDEFAAYRDSSGNWICPEFGGATQDQIFACRHWMGKALGQYVRHYNATAMAKANNVSELSYASALPSLTLTGVAGTYNATGGPSNAPYGRYAATNGYGSTFSAGNIAKTISRLTAGNPYVVLLTMRATQFKEVYVTMTNVHTGLANTTSAEIQQLDTTWRTYVFQIHPTAASIWLSIQCGWHKGDIDIAEIMVIPGNAGGLSRDFDNALALANISNEPFTFTLPNGASYKKLTGTQDPTINDGSSVSGSITIPARDGLILGKVL